MSSGKELALGGLVHLGNGMIFIDCVYCQCLYPILRFLKTILVFAAPKKFTEDTNSLKALTCATSVLRDSAELLFLLWTAGPAGSWCWLG